MRVAARPSGNPTIRPRSDVTVPNQTLKRATHAIGKVELPGDKSIAHRAAIFAALSEGRCEIVNFPDSGDPRSTLECLRQLGVEIEEGDRSIVVHGVGLQGFRAPQGPLNCGNSGTTMRLLTGVLVGQPFSAELVGDPSLSSRPMERIAAPLRSMGARITLEEGHPPVRIEGTREPLKPIEYSLPVASAQVKSAVLLAGLYADGETAVIESAPTRDHTERMLRLETVSIGKEHRITVTGGRKIPSRTWAIPRDFSAAAFFLVAGAITPNADLMINGVGLNPSRAAALDVLTAMGARIDVSRERTYGGEPIADLRVRSSALVGVRIAGATVPNLIDEIPILAVAAARADGVSNIRDASELRVKESDRIAWIVKNLRALGSNVEEHDDGMTIHGGAAWKARPVDSAGDHRLAMAMGVAALVAEGHTTIRDADCAEVSFPGFWEQLRSVTGQ